MTKTLFLAWQDKRGKGAVPATRRWFPVGRLDADTVAGGYRFQYVKGAKQARTEAGFQALTAFPDLNTVYESSQLFELFRNRVPRASRADYPALLKRLGLTATDADPFEVLAVTGGTRQTDNLEVFPQISKEKGGRFHCRFFLHGWRHVSAAAQERIATLGPGQPLRIALELNNPATAIAIQIQSKNDYLVLGWTPRYLVRDLARAIGNAPSCLKAQVHQVNESPAPSSQRVLITLTGVLPAGVEPMSSEEFQPLRSEASLPSH